VRSAAISGSNATVRWLSPPDDELTGFVVEAREGGSWDEVARVSATATQATFPASGSVHVRVRPQVTGVSDPLPSDTARIDPSPSVLVVDGFDRTLGGSFAGLSHDFASLIGDAAGRSVAYASNEAVIEGEVDLGDYDAVVWMLGDESSLDRAFSSEERTLVKSYLSSGGKLIATGSEVAYSLNGVDNSFLGQLGATYGSDDAGTNRASGAGALASVGNFNFGGSGAPYAEDYPDTLGASGGASVLLKYDTGTNAAVGLSGKAVLVGFPLETIEDDAKRGQVLDALLDFVGA
jgi:hypothetical protein